jgi:hypothetical protein
MLFVELRLDPMDDLPGGGKGLRSVVVAAGFAAREISVRYVRHLRKQGLVLHLVCDLIHQILLAVFFSIRLPRFVETIRLIKANLI